jgi:exodeoxyribonuclease VIII
MTKNDNQQSGRINVMIDIETLDTSREATILSIGAVKFDIINGIHEDKFYKEVNTDKGQNKDRSESEETIEWWKKQEAPYSRDGEPLCEVMERFSSWFERGGTVDKVWAKSPEFDVEILNDAAEDCGTSLPWKYYQHKDVRTVYDEFEQSTGNSPEPDRDSTDHHALEDAVDQALGTLISMRDLRS